MDETFAPPGEGGRDDPPPRFMGYELLGEIARGGQGVVYRARHMRLETVVALKVLLDPDPRLTRRFVQEAQVLARLKHGSLIDVSDLGEVQGRPYLVMELVDGDDLKQVVKQRGTPDLAWSVRVVRAVADALHYCHQQGIVHRDVKPANVLLERATERPILVDFGLIRRDVDKMSLGLDQDGRLSVSGEVKGTPAFMAPEQAGEDASVGPRSDVYGLGATLYFLLTGEAPFSGTTALNVLNKVLTVDPPSPRDRNATVPLALAKLCQRSMAKDPEDRPESAAAFAKELEAAVRPTQRRGVLLAGGALLALAGLGLGLAVWTSAATNDPLPDPHAKVDPVDEAAEEPPAEEPPPAEPTPAEPTPAEPTPAEPTPAEPTPAEPTPEEPTPEEAEARALAEVMDDRDPPPPPPPLDPKPVQLGVGVRVMRNLREPMWWLPHPAQRAHAEATQRPFWFRDQHGQTFVTIPPADDVPAQYLGATEVTNAQFRRFQPDHRVVTLKGLRPHPSILEALNAPNAPVVGVSWNQAQAYCAWLNEQTPGAGYRLPTEAEWARGARGGIDRARYWGDTLEGSARHENLLTRAQADWLGYALKPGDAATEDDGHTLVAPVARFLPNLFGLYDMLGNVMEWCSGEDGGRRPFRGGGWVGYARLHALPSFRETRLASQGFYYVGFRLALDEVPEGAVAHPTTPPPPPSWEPAPEQLQHAKREGVPVQRSVELAGHPIEFVLVPPGTFLMGRHAPGQAREVTLTRGFYLGRTEVTYQQYAAWKGGRSDDAPAPGFDRHKALAFCAWLTEQCPGTFRLPTDAEWEYACRAGATTRFPWGDDAAELPKHANTLDRSAAPLRYHRQPYASELRTASPYDGYLLYAPVGRLLPNRWGLHDMLGNLTEWVSDNYAPLTPEPARDPVGAPSGQGIVRGAHYDALAGPYCYPHYRPKLSPSRSAHYFGMRLVWEP